METVSIDTLLITLPDHDRQDRFIRQVLIGLKAEGHTTLERHVYPSWQPILVPGHTGTLFLILSGNASITFSRASIEPERFTRELTGIANSNNPVTKLIEK